MYVILIEYKQKLNPELRLMYIRRKNNEMLFIETDCTFFSKLEL